MIKLTDYEKEHRKAVKGLDTYVKKNFSEEEQEIIEWYNDAHTDTHYVWKFDLHGKTHVLKARLDTGKVEV